MDINFLWLVLAQLVIIGIIIIVKLVNDHREQKKIDYILDFINKRAKENNDGKQEQRVKECLEILKEKEG